MEDRSRMIEGFFARFPDLVNSLKSIRAKKAVCEAEASRLLGEKHVLERQLEEERADQNIVIQNLQTSIDMQPVGEDDAPQKEVEAAVALSVRQDLKMMREQIRTMKVENITVTKRLEDQDVKKSEESSLSVEIEASNIECIGKILSEQILKLKDEQQDVQAAIDRVGAVSGQFQSDGVTLDQQLSNLSAENKDLLVELGKLETSLTLENSRYSSSRLSKPCQSEAKTQEIEEELKNLTLNGQHLEKELDNLRTELKAIKTSVENSKNLNESLRDIGRNGTAGTTREQEKNLLLGLIDEEETKWAERKLQIESQE